jgi:hypothetical protein
MVIPTTWSLLVRLLGTLKTFYQEPPLCYHTIEWQDANSEACCRKVIESMLLGSACDRGKGITLMWLSDVLIKPSSRTLYQMLIHMSE